MFSSLIIRNCLLKIITIIRTSLKTTALSVELPENCGEGTRKRLIRHVTCFIILHSTIFFFLPQTIQNHLCKTMKTFWNAQFTIFKPQHRWVTSGIPAPLPHVLPVVDTLSTLIFPATFLAHNDYFLMCSCRVRRQVCHITWRFFSNISEYDGRFVDYSGSSDSDDPLESRIQWFSNYGYPKLGREINFDGSQGHRKHYHVFSVSVYFSYLIELFFFNHKLLLLCMFIFPHLPPPGPHVMVSLTGMTPVSNAYVGLAVGPCRLVRGVCFPSTAGEGGCAVCNHLCE